MLSTPSDYSCLVSAAPVVSGIKSKPSCHITASEEKTMWDSFGMQKQFFGCHTQKVELICLPGESVSTCPVVILPAHRHPALPQCPHSLKMIAASQMCPLQSTVCLKRQQLVIFQRNHLCEPVLRCIALWLAEQKL